MSARETATPLPRSRDPPTHTHTHHMMTARRDVQTVGAPRTCAQQFGRYSRGFSPFICRRHLLHHHHHHRRRRHALLLLLFALHASSRPQNPIALARPNRRGIITLQQPSRSANIKHTFRFVLSRYRKKLQIRKIEQLRKFVSRL